MLPGVDDGPADTEEALEMIEASYIDGIRHIAMTSHLNHPLGFPGEDDYDGIFCDFKKLVKGHYPDLEIYPAAEVYISRKMLSEMDKIDIRSINNTKYVLVEFSRNVRFHEMDMAVHELKIMGYKVIIAHLEQYHSVREKYDDIRQLKADGAVIQCNAENFSKDSRYSRVVEELMKRNLVDLVASDCHNTVDRAPGLRKTFDAVSRKYGRMTAERMFLENPERIIKGEDLAANPVDTTGKKGGMAYRSLIMKLAAVAAVGIVVAALLMSKGILPVPDIEVAAGDEDSVKYVEAVDDVEEKDVAETEKVNDEGMKDTEYLDTNADDNNNSIDDNNVSGYENRGDESADVDEYGTGSETVEKSDEEILVGGYVSYLEDLEAEYMETCESYYTMLKAAIDIEDEAERDAEIDDILDELGRVETRSDNQVYKTLYDMQNDLEECEYDVAVVRELREHYLDVKMEVSEEYKAQLEEYGNLNL